ncbi:L-aspartate oxidase [Pontivivens insulae]|uniref:L-aspartate oxidase n=1 Tax=Pontivivens insulae TaxID=1639689 RepID=A0A2R8ACQ2_9RHOB|nr:L-aspartate oxidase [Pontivivens insulae]RED13957.1 L-aspartate oxidase [Pontivivens insulae]SPF30031.1 L-aspartate oxidase [Pontivivens insulae]
MSDNLHDIAGTLIIGAGLAGLFTALKLAPRPCTVLSPEVVGTGASSAWAQGGIAAAVGLGDTAEAHAADTVAAGAGLVDADVALSVTAEGADRIFDLLAYGAPFDKDSEGKLIQSKEAAHSTNRVVRVSGDQAGRAIMDALVRTARDTPSITILERIVVDDLAIADGRVVGAFARRTDDPMADPVLIRASETVLATGGVGGLYAVTTNPARVRGQGLGMAARAGAKLADTEFVQFHPTGIAVDRDPCPLATEALRGHGAALIDGDNHRFVFDTHPDGELAPRDIVARAIHAKNLSGGQAYLDTREVLGAQIYEEFPTVAEYCREAGIDPVKNPIPVRPAQHYHMGGLLTDQHGRTTLDGLWCAGEVSSTGLHGANRLASNSLLEAVVYANRIAQDILTRPAVSQVGRLALAPSLHGPTPFELPMDAIAALRTTMDRDVGVVRTPEGLRRALQSIARLEAQHAPASRAFLNMTTAATVITAAAWLRTESRGGQFRTDFPDPDPAQAHRRTITLREALAVRAEA